MTPTGTSLPPLTARRAVTTEVLAGLCSILALGGMPQVWVDGGYGIRSWAVVVVALAGMGLVIGLAARATARRFRGPWADAAATGQLTGDADVDLSAVDVVERHASRVTSVVVMSSCYLGLWVFLTASRPHAPWWPLTFTVLGVAASWTLVLVTRPRARAKAIRARYLRGWMQHAP